MTDPLLPFVSDFAHAAAGKIAPEPVPDSAIWHLWRSAVEAAGALDGAHGNPEVRLYGLNERDMRDLAALANIPLCETLFIGEPGEPTVLAEIRTSLGRVGVTAFTNRRATCADRLLPCQRRGAYMVERPPQSEIDAALGVES